jgi:hypothetical protein
LSISRDPGPKAGGIKGSGFLSIENDDPSAERNAVSAQFGTEIPAFAKPTFERLRRARHSAQYFDPSAPPLAASDATWPSRKRRKRCRE